MMHMGGYHEYIRGCSTLGEYYEYIRGYHEYIREIS